MSLMTTTQMTKAQLIAHIDDAHPEHVYPTKKDGLGKWRKDELELVHAELHAMAAEEQDASDEDRRVDAYQARQEAQADEMNARGEW